MARTLTNAMHVLRHLLHSGQAWLQFVEIISPLPGPTYRLVRDRVHRQANGVWWQAAAFEVELPPEDAEGTLASGRLRLPNTSGLPLAIAEAGGLDGAEVVWWVQHETALTTFTPELSIRMVALTATADSQTLEVELGQPAGLLGVPGATFDRTRFPQLLPSGGLSR